MQTKIILGLIIVSLISLPVAARAANINVKSYILRWDDNSSILSPDRKWSVKTQYSSRVPMDTYPISLYREDDGKSTILLEFDREAQLFWGTNNQLLIINKPGGGHEEALMFSLYFGENNEIARKLNGFDQALRSEISKLIGNRNSIAFYMVQPVDWINDRISLMVSGTAAPEEGGRMTAYCEVFEVDSAKGKVLKRRSRIKDVKAIDWNRCKTFP